MSNAAGLTAPPLRVAGRPILLMWVATVPLWISSTLDLSRHVYFGPVSGSGMLSLVQLVILTVAALALGVYPWRLLRSMLPYVGFLAWGGLSVFWTAFLSVNGTQNAVVYTLFGTVIVLVGSLVARHPDDTLAVVDRAIRGVDWIALGLAAASLALRGFPTDEFGWLIGPRSFALLGLVVISWHLAQWYHGRRGEAFRTWCWLTAIALSLSRTATAIAALSVGLAVVLKGCARPRDLLIRVPLLLAGMAVTGVVVMRATPFQERFVTGDLSLEIAGTQVNASGRMQMWPIVIASARAQPIIGQGLGSSQHAILEMGDTIGHPHNDYLRLWHDLGLVGLVLFVVAVAGWFAALFNSWRRAARVCPLRAPAPLAAMFALLGLLFAAMTDNAIVYPFVMGPLGVVVGGGLAAGMSLSPQPSSRKPRVIR